MEHKIPSYKSSEYVRDKTTVDILWKQLGTLQDVAEEYGIENIFQDNGAEILQQLVYLNMHAVPGREGNDGVDINGCEWEMKSIDISKNNSGITTNHHLNADIIEKYKTVPWSISIYDRIHLKKIYVVGNKQLHEIFQEWEQLLQSKDTLNNPKIPLKTIEEKGVLVFDEKDDYPIDPMGVIDTKPYLPLQEAYFDKIQKQRKAKEATKAVQKARKALEKAKKKYEVAELDAKDKETAAKSSQPSNMKAAKRAASAARQKANNSHQNVVNKDKEFKQACAAETAAETEAKAANAAFTTALKKFNL